MKNGIRQYIAVLALVLVGMFGGVGSVYADVTGPEWGQEGGSWYILYAGDSTRSSNDLTKTYSVYMPPITGNYDVNFVYSFTVCGQWGFTGTRYPGVDMYVNTNLDNYSTDWSGLSAFAKTGYTHQSKPINNFPQCSTIKIGWTQVTASIYSHSCEKACSLQIKLPYHVDLVSTDDDSYDFQTKEIFTKNSHEFDFEPYFKTYSLVSKKIF